MGIKKGKEEPNIFEKVPNKSFKRLKRYKKIQQKLGGWALQQTDTADERIKKLEDKLEEMAQNAT